ncbi:unnamed protein product, partial [Timema podura]|nr:unnamed protein product [Timema podura]
MVFSLNCRLLNEVTITWQKCGQLMNQQKLWPCLLFDASTFPTCTRCHLLHTSSINHKRRKTAEERKAPKLIEYSPKSKAVAVDVWKNMTVEDVAKTLNKDLVLASQSIKSSMKEGLCPLEGSAFPPPALATQEW